MDRLKRVSRAGKDLLTNTIQSVEYQNRVLEERSCWRSLSHDTRKRVLRQSPKRVRRDDVSRVRQNRGPESGSPAGASDKWDHSGFRELYPDRKVPSASPSIIRPKADESSGSQTSSSSSLSDSSSSDSGDERRHRKRHKRKKRHHPKKKRKKETDYNCPPPRLTHSRPDSGRRHTEHSTKNK